MPAAAGIALAHQLRGTDDLSVSFIGDGTLGEGIIYETLNLASLWHLPLLVVVEDNGWAQSTPSALNLAGGIAARFAAFGLPLVEVDSTDVLEVEQAAGEAVADARARRGPGVLVIHTYRLCHHSKNDDNRPSEEVEARRALDPLAIHGRRIGDRERERIDEEVDRALGAVVRGGEADVIFARVLGDTLRRLLEDDPRVVILGEDVVDPYGGAFKVTRGLSTDFPDRVRATPISEGAIAGVAAGLALAGYRPIAEIMFGDFLTLCFDQVVNHIAKYEAMYDGGATCPVILRTPSGGGRGYGPTHSQSLEKHFLGVPHLRVVAASLHHDPDRVFDVLLAGGEQPCTSSTSCSTRCSSRRRTPRMLRPVRCRRRVSGRSSARRAR